VFALATFGVGYALGSRAGYNNGYSQGAHDVCTNFSAAEAQ
jgi:hypothetical protein